MASVKPTAKLPGKKAAIIGGGLTGIAAAYSPAAAWKPRSSSAKRSSAGVPRYVIPRSRISDEALDKGLRLMERLGVEVKCGAPAPAWTRSSWAIRTFLMATGAHGRRANSASPVMSRVSSAG